MKRCIKERCNSPVFSKGLCKYHIPKKRIKHKSDKVIAISKTLGPETQYASELLMFNDIWINRADKNGIHYSFISNVQLAGMPPLYLNHFAHVLSKKDFPLFRLYDRNIVLLTPYEHLLYDNGTLDQRTACKDCEWTLLANLRDKLYKEYLSYDSNATKMLKTII